MPLDPVEFMTAPAELILTKLQELELLVPGDYDVTPRIWTRNTHTHELTVFDNGEGLYRLRPKDEQVGTVIMEGSTTGPVQPGGNNQPINADHPWAIIAGGHPKKQGIHIFGLIAYL